MSTLVYNTLEAPIRRSSPARSSSSPSRSWRGKVGFAPSETDFQPLVTAIVKLDGRAAAERWLKGLQADGRIYPDNETVVAQVNNGESADRPDQPATTGTGCAQEQGAAATHSALHYYAAGDPGDLVDVSGAAILKSSSKKPAAQKLLAFLVSGAGQADDRAQPQLRVPAAPRRQPRRRGFRPLSSFDPNALTPAELGDGQRSARAGAAAGASLEDLDEHATRPPSSRPAGSPTHGPGRRRWPLVSIAGGTLAAGLVLLPLAFLVVQAQQSGWGEVRRLLLRHSVAVLLWNTVRLTLACTVLCAAAGDRRGLVRGAHRRCRCGGCGRCCWCCRSAFPTSSSASAGSRSTRRCTGTWRR